MRQFLELEKEIQSNTEIRKLAMDIAQFMFSKSQENLNKPMPWGDEKYLSNRKATAISDTGVLLLSGVPPRWTDNNTLIFKYDAPYASFVEYGTPPHAVGSRRLIGWARRKLGLKGRRAVSAAYAIAAKIRKEGMAPHPFIRPAVEETAKNFRMVTVRLA